MGTTVLDVRNVSKSFTMHLQGGLRLPVLRNVSLSLKSGECLALAGPSGIGKSSLLRMIYANYRCDCGSIRVRHGEEWIEVIGADPRQIRRIRRRTLGYVSQFLRVIPRVSTLALVTAAGRDAGSDEVAAQARAKDLLDRLNVPARLWPLPPATFSGGEQQRVNIARGLIGDHAVLLADEPTASLDAVNRDVVVELLLEAKSRGIAILGIFHDASVRERVCDRSLDVSQFTSLS